MAAADNANGNGAATGSWQENVVMGRPMSTWLKIGALGLMFFGILFNYTILRDTKVWFPIVIILPPRLSFSQCTGYRAAATVTAIVTYPFLVQHLRCADLTTPGVAVVLPPCSQFLVHTVLLPLIVQLQPCIIVPGTPEVVSCADSLAILQDVLVVTAPGSGAEIIPFLKTWVNLPAAIVFTIGYAQVRGFLPVTVPSRAQDNLYCTAVTSPDDLHW